MSSFFLFRPTASLRVCAVYLLFALAPVETAFAQSAQSKFADVNGVACTI